MCGDSERWRRILQERLSGWPGWEIVELPLLLVSMAISDPDFGFGVDPGRLRGYPRAHLAGACGGDQPRTTSMPFQRISTDFCGSPDHPRRAETAERITWGTKTPPRPPQPAPHPHRPVCGRNHGAGTHWCPSGGDSPVAVPRPPALRVLSLCLRQYPRPLAGWPGRTPSGTSRHKQGPRSAEFKAYRSPSLHSDCQ
jgi:hypothetical protein